MQNNIYRIKRSSIIGILIVYYVLMDSSFPFATNSFGLKFFYWSKFILAMIVIFYARFFSAKKIKYSLKKSCRSTCRLFIVPWILMLLYSGMVWLLQNTHTPYITRGVSNFLSNIIPIMLGTALVIIFQEKIIELTVIAVCLMAITNYITGVIINGPSFIVQLFNINCEESIYRVYKELHEIAYISGLFLLYYFHKKEYKINKTWIFMIFACFFFSWKRIGIFALLLALLFSEILMHLNKCEKKFGIIVCGIIATFFSIVYVYFSASDELSILLHKYGINMMGRDVLYSYFRKFCSFSVGFFGRGIGFVSRQFNYLTYDDVGDMVALKQGLHNDLFSIYLEIGMFGFWGWIIYQLIYAPQKIYKYFGLNSAVQYFTYIVFTFVTYTTDNTLRYFVYQMVLVMIIAVSNYENSNKKNIKRGEIDSYENYA